MLLRRAPLLGQGCRGRGRRGALTLRTHLLLQLLHRHGRRDAHRRQLGLRLLQLLRLLLLLGLLLLGLLQWPRQRRQVLQGLLLIQTLLQATVYDAAQAVVVESASVCRRH